MNFVLTITVLNPRPDSIYARLRDRLGREPHNHELRAECERILAETAPRRRGLRR